jgi:hypothetical protein
MITIKYIATLVLLLFTAYTVFCSRKESIVKSAKQVFSLHWGRQVTIDLYIGLFIFSFFIYLIEGDVLITFLWLVPTLILGNIVPLIYLIFNFDILIAHFVS